MMGRAGLIATPYFVAMLYDTYGIAGIGLVLSGMYLTLAVIIGVFGLETNQKSLEALALADHAPATAQEDIAR